MLTVTLTLDDIDYAALAERMLAMKSDDIEKTEKKTLGKKIGLLFMKAAGFLAPKTAKLFGGKIDQKIVIWVVGKFKAKIINEINKCFAEQKFSVTLKDISVK
jgi:hypothetical protein